MSIRSFKALRRGGGGRLSLVLVLESNKTPSRNVLASLRLVTTRGSLRSQLIPYHRTLMKLSLAALNIHFSFYTNFFFTFHNGRREVLFGN